jgi:tetrahydromethanopterin S-methyltransferase subunit G
LKTVIEDVKELRQHLAEFKEEVPKVYTSKADFERDFSRIMERFDRIDQKLDSVIAGRRSGEQRA